MRPVVVPRSPSVTARSTSVSIVAGVVVHGGDSGTAAREGDLGSPDGADAGAPPRESIDFEPSSARPPQAVTKARSEAIRRFMRRRYPRPHAPIVGLS